MRKKWIGRIAAVAAAVLLAVVCLVLLYRFLDDGEDGIPMSAEEIAAYDAYAAAVPDGRSITEFVLSVSEFTQTITTEDQQQISYYTSALLPEYLYNCAELNAICVYEGYLLINYTTQDGEDVGLTYAGNELAAKTIFNPQTETCVRIYENGQRGTIYDSFTQRNDEMVTWIRRATGWRPASATCSGKQSAAPVWRRALLLL